MIKIMKITIVALSLLLTACSMQAPPYEVSIKNVQNIKTGNVIELHEELKSYLPESAVRKANGNLRTTSVTHFSNLGGKQKLFYKDILADKRYNYQL